MYSTLNVIEKLCNIHNISKGELERNLNFSNSLISKWDKSFPKTDKIVAIAKYFNVSADYLLGLTETPTPVDQILDEYTVKLQRLVYHMSTRDKKKMMDIIRIHFTEDFAEVDSE